MASALSQNQVFTIQFDYLTLEIRYSPKPFDAVDIEHYEIITLKPERAPHPMSETGYKSLFIHPQWTKQFNGDARDFIDFALEEAAKKPAWKDIQANARQLSLF